MKNKFSNIDKKTFFNIWLLSFIICLILLVVLKNDSILILRIKWFLIFVMCVSMGISGLFMIIRKEGPGFIPDGKLAVIYGVIIFVVQIPVAIFSLVIIFLP